MPKVNPRRVCDVLESRGIRIPRTRASPGGRPYGKQKNWEYCQESSSTHLGVMIAGKRGNDDNGEGASAAARYQTKKGGLSRAALFRMDLPQRSELKPHGELNNSRVEHAGNLSKQVVRHGGVYAIGLRMVKDIEHFRFELKGCTLFI